MTCHYRNATLKLRAEEEFNPNQSEKMSGERDNVERKEIKTTYVDINPGDVEDLGGRVFGGRESVEFVSAPVPLEGVERRRLKIIITPQNRLLTTLHHVRDYFQTDLPQAARTFQENENRNEALSLVRIISPLFSSRERLHSTRQREIAIPPNDNFPHPPIPGCRRLSHNCMQPQTHARAGSHIHASVRTHIYTYIY